VAEAAIRKSRQILVPHGMTISLAFLAPDLVRAAVEGIGVERLRDAPAEWSREFEGLGLNPQ
jgi:hypothetical protein